MMKTSDAIISAPRGSVSGAKHRARFAKRNADTMRYIDYLWQYAIAAGVDPAIVFAQWDLETNTGQSYWWEARLNPAGIGITGDPNQNAASAYFTPEKAARAQVAHLVLYATGTINRGGLSPADDPRYEAYRAAYGTKARATTIDGLTNTWAIDSGYATKLVSRGNAIWPNLEPYNPPTPDPEPEPDPVPDPNDVPSKYEPVDKVLNEDGTEWKGQQSIIVGTAIVFAQVRTVSVNNLTKARKWGTVSAGSVAPDYKPGDTFTALGFYAGTLGDEEGFWWISDKYHRVWAGDTFDTPFTIR